jgi:hypothetical protein
MAFLSFQLPDGSYDINVTPDKRSVFMQKEAAIMAALGQVSSPKGGRGESSTGSWGWAGSQ